MTSDKRPERQAPVEPTGITDEEWESPRDRSIRQANEGCAGCLPGMLAVLGLLACLMLAAWRRAG